MSIRNRVLVILGLIALSVFHLVPRNVTLRERDPKTGVMSDHTEKRIPLKLGLDLQGGMHLALELDQSKQVSADPKRDLDLALTVLRKRIDEFGVSDETNALEKAIPAMDRVLRGMGIRGERPSGRPSAVEQLLGGDTAARAHTSPKGAPA